MRFSYAPVERTYVAVGRTTYVTKRKQTSFLFCIFPLIVVV